MGAEVTDMEAGMLGGVQDAHRVPGGGPQHVL